MDALAGRVRAMYVTYNADKLDDVPALLAKYTGKEAKLLKALVKKYGPEPPATSAATMMKPIAADAATGASATGSPAAAAAPAPSPTTRPR